MLTPSGDVKVMDFGIARAMADASSTMTQTAAVVGTAQYLSPEQARGETVDSRSDVYSTGCLLYELLTGRPPFVGESPVSVAYQHVREQAAPPSSLDPDLPPEVDRIVMQALAKPIDERYQSAAAMRADIERYLAGQPIVAPPLAGTAVTPAYADSGDEPTSFFGDRPDEDDEEERKKRWPLFLAGLAILALLIGAVVFGPMLFSSAPEQNAVPSVIDMTRKQAEQRIEDAGLSVGDVSKEASTDYRKGLVMDQDPSAPVDARARLRGGHHRLHGRPRRGGAVGDRLTTSSTPSPRSRTRPGWPSSPGAVRRRAGHGDPDRPGGCDERERRQHRCGSSGPPGPRAVPGVVGLQEDEARAGLERAGFEVPASTRTSRPWPRPGRCSSRARRRAPPEPGHHRDDHGLDLRAGADADPDAHPDGDAGADGDPDAHGVAGAAPGAVTGVRCGRRPGRRQPGGPGIAELGRAGVPWASR